MGIKYIKLKSTYLMVKRILQSNKTRIFDLEFNVNEVTQKTVIQFARIRSDLINCNH